MKRVKRFLIILSCLICFPCPVLCEESPIKLGATLMLTGYGAPWGKNAQQGIEMALEEVNASGGISGKRIEVIYEDYGEMNLKRVASAAQKLINSDGVVALLTLIIEDSEVVSPIAEKKGIVTISVGAGSRECGKDSPYLFRTTSSDDSLVKAGIEYALKQGKKRACILADQVRYYEIYADYTAEIWKQRIGTAPLMFKYPWASTDFRTILTKVRVSGCDVAFLQTGIPAQGVLLKQAASLGLKTLIIGPPTTDDPSVLDVAGAGADDVVFAKYKPGTPRFAKTYKEKYGENPSRPAATAYDAISLLAEVLRKNGTDPESIRKGLLGVRNFKGVSGPLTIDKNGDRIGEIPELLVVKEGVATVVK